MNKYAVIGNPIAHSLSPQIHLAFAKQIKHPIEYIKIEAPLDDFKNTVNLFFATGGKGCNITAPFKERAFALATHHSKAAALAQAANTLTLLADNSLLAENTDGTGLIRDLTQNHRADLNQKTILILGAGGATRGILGPLLAESPTSVVIANRTRLKAEALANAFQPYGDVYALSLNQLAEQHKPFDFIIHASSLGHQDGTLTLPSTLVDEETWCYDLSYGKAAKPFLRWAKKHGAKQALNGFGMLVEQAAAAFHRWEKHYPKTQTVITEYRSSKKGSSL